MAPAAPDTGTTASPPDTARTISSDGWPTGAARLTRRRAAGGLAAAAAMLVGAARTAGSQVGSGTAPGAAWPAEMTWMAWSAGNQWLTPTYERVAGAFSEAHPATRLTVVPAGGPFLEKIKTLVAAGTPPDVTDTHQTQVRDLGPGGIVVPLDGYLKRDRYPKDYVGWGPYAWQKKQYGVPWAIQSTAIFYNKALFDQAGVPYPTDMWTWDDFAAAARRLTKPGADAASTIWGAGDQGGRNYQWIDALLVAYGGGVLRKDFGAVAITEPASLRGLEFRAGWGTALRIAPAQPGGTSGTFGGGKLAMVTSGSWYVANVKQNAQTQLVASGVPWDVAPVPKGPPRRGALAHELGIGVPTGVASPDASWAAVRHLTSPTALVPFAQIGRVIPPQKSLWAQAVPEDNVPRGFKHAFLDLWDEIDLEAPFVPHRPEAVAIWQETLDGVWKGERSPREGAQDFAARMGTFLQQLKGEGLL